MAALIISLLAIFLTVWQGWVTRAHNRLSVRPYVVSRQKKGSIEDGVSISYEFINSGLGPAIVDELVVTLAGERITGSDRVEELLRRCVAGKLPYILRSSSVPSPGYCLNPQEEYLFADLFFPGLTPEQEFTLGELLRPADLKLHYASFYGEKFVFPPEKKGKKEANQSLEPTRVLGTSAAEPPRVPSTRVAHL